jgi:hypothetical protein
MRARLITRCNCEREMVITSPPPPYILVPIRTSDSLFHLQQLTDDDLTKPNFGVRQFDYYGMSGSVADYLESHQYFKEQVSDG